MPLDFHHPTGKVLQALVLHEGFELYKLPHKDGESANVGSLLAKTFIQYVQDGTPTSPGDEARSTLDMNMQCSYWVSTRDCAEEHSPVHHSDLYIVLEMNV